MFCFVVASPTSLPDTRSGSYIRVLVFSALLGLSAFPRDISIPRHDQTSRAFATSSEPPPPPPPPRSALFHFPASFPTSSTYSPTSCPTSCPTSSSCSSLPRFEPATSIWLRRRFSEVSSSRRVLGNFTIFSYVILCVKHRPHLINRTSSSSTISGIGARVHFTSSHFYFLSFLLSVELSSTLRVSRFRRQAFVTER